MINDKALMIPGEAALAEAAWSANTRRAYRTYWRRFGLWAAAEDVGVLPARPEDVARYLASLEASGASAAVATTSLASISHAHLLAGLNDPCSDRRVELVRRGFIRTRGRAPQRQARPLTVEEVRAMVGACPEHTPLGLRDRALLVVGFGSGMRRSELSALDVADLSFELEGLVVRVRRSKTDQEGVGSLRAIPRAAKHPELDATVAVDRYLRAIGDEGPLFRTGARRGQLRAERLQPEGVAVALRRIAKKAGVDTGLLSGHSLRAGYATAALEAGATVQDVARSGGWSDVRTVSTYDRRGKWTQNAAGRVL